MNKKIMVPLDGSSLAEEALPCAEELCGRLGAEVILVGVCHSKKDQLQNMRRSYLNRVVEAISRRIMDNYGVSRDKVTVNDAMLFGKPAKEIVNYADKYDIDLIIMTTHGYSGFDRWAIGNVADTVVRETGKPVLLIRVRDDKAAVQQKEICTKSVIPLDGSILAEAALPIAEAFMGGLAKHYQVEAHLLLVMRPLPHQEQLTALKEKKISLYNITDENLHRLDMLVKDNTEIYQRYLHKASEGLLNQGVDVNCEVRTGEPADEIIKYADEIGASTIIMSTHGASGADRWILGSVSDRVLRKGKTALLLVSPF